MRHARFRKPKVSYICDLLSRLRDPDLDLAAYGYIVEALLGQDAEAEYDLAVINEKDALRYRQEYMDEVMCRDIGEPDHDAA
jgi:hypothetical protein